MDGEAYFSRNALSEVSQISIIHKSSSQYCIVIDVKDGVFCMSCFQVGLGISNSCRIIPLLVSSFVKH